jgi:hypothetical protein
MRSGNVEIRGDVVEIVDLKLEGVADALAADLRAAISTQPSGKWNKTGELLRSIKRSGADVVVSANRLERDPALAQKFASEVMPADPLASDAVLKASEAAVNASAKVTRG